MAARWGDVTLGRVVVLPEYRGRKLGMMAICEAEKWIVDCGYTEIDIESRENRRMYDAKMLKAGIYLRASRYYRLDGTRIK